MRQILASRRARVTSIALALVAFACGGDGGKSTGPSSASGTYALESVNGALLPFTQSGSDEDGPYTATFATACCSVILGGDGSYTRSVQTRFAQQGIDQTVKIEDRGQYAVSSSGVRFISASALIAVDGTILVQAPVVDTSAATLIGDRLTMAGDDPTGTTATSATFVFRRQ